MDSSHLDPLDVEHERVGGNAISNPSMIDSYRAKERQRRTGQRPADYLPGILAREKSQQYTTNEEDSPCLPILIAQSLELFTTTF